MLSRYRFSVLLGAPGPLVDELARMDISVHLIPKLARTLNPRATLVSLGWLIRYIKVLQPSLVHGHSSNAGLISRFAAFFCRVPVVFTAHGWGFKKGVPIPRRVIVYLSEAIAAFITDRIICVSAADLILAQRCLPVPRGRLAHIPNGVADDHCRARPGTEPPTIVMVARFQEPKNQALLLRAFARVRQEAQLTFVGDGPNLNEVRRLASTLGVSKRVAFLGNRTDVAHILAGSQIFALASDHEGLPISILEAMRAGLPVVGSAVGGIPEQIDHGKTGFLVSSSISELSSALERLVASADLRERLGSAARLKYVREFSDDVMLNAVAKIYGELVGE